MAIGPLPSTGWPSELTTRPSIASPTGTEMMRPVRLTWSPSFSASNSPSRTDADAVLLEVQRDAEQAVGKLEHLAGHGLVHALDARDAVADRHDGADFGDVDVEREAAQLFPDDPRDVVCLDAHRYTFSTSFCRMRASCRVTLPSYTVLSICVTTPPMMAGVHLRLKRHLACRSAPTAARPAPAPCRPAAPWPSSPWRARTPCFLFEPLAEAGRDRAQQVQRVKLDQRLEQHRRSAC